MGCCSLIDEDRGWSVRVGLADLFRSLALLGGYIGDSATPPSPS